MAVSTIFDTGKKYTIWHYGLGNVQEMNLQDNMRVSKCDEYCIYEKFFVS